MSYIITEECLACGACLMTCPSDAIAEGEVYVIGDNCLDCGICVDSCPIGAIIEQ